MSGLDAVRRINLPSHRDGRGFLTAIESGQDIPFDIKRVFFVHQIQAERGGHAHRHTDQIIVAIAGAFSIDLLDGRDTRTFRLDDATAALFVPAMVFCRIYDCTPQAVCLVLASTHYDMSHSLRTWDSYLEAVKDR